MFSIIWRYFWCHNWGQQVCYRHPVGRARRAADILQFMGWSPKQRLILPQMSVVLRLRNPIQWDDGKERKGSYLFLYLKPHYHLSELRWDRI